MWLFVTKLANVWHIRKFCSDFMPPVVLRLLVRICDFSKTGLLFLTGGLTFVHLRC